MGTYTVQAFFNLNRREAAFDGYGINHTLIRSNLLPFEVDADNVAQAGECAFAILNRDSRPNGQYEPSLSVGDVLEITDENRNYWISVNGTGLGLLDRAPEYVVPAAPFEEWPIV